MPLFLVRAGNPKQIHDWNDLARAGVQVVFPNPRTSGNGRYSYLAAYAYALRQNNESAAKAGEFVSRLLANVPVFDTGGRGNPCRRRNSRQGRIRQPVMAAEH
jgi:sulfate transport system substrate-binding protein